MLKAAFLDRDGVINVNKGYIHSIDDFAFTPGCQDALKALVKLEYALVIITNQSGIARGYYTESDYHRLTDWMLDQFNREQIPILCVRYCPHLATGLVTEYALDCDCRKPKPGMILDVASDYGIDLQASILVGDNLSDIQAGQAAGVGKLFLVGDQRQVNVNATCQQFDSLAAVSKFLVLEASASAPEN